MQPRQQESPGRRGRTANSNASGSASWRPATNGKTGSPPGQGTGTRGSHPQASDAHPQTSDAKSGAVGSQKRGGHADNQPTGGVSFATDETRSHDRSPAYQGVGTRFVALLIDGVVVTLLLVAMTIGTVFTGMIGMLGPGNMLLWGGLLSTGYFVFLEGYRGQTVGKALCNIRVVTTDGGPITYRQALIRNLVRVIDGFAFYLVGAFVIYRFDRAQRLGDQIGNTIVVRG